MAGQKVLLVEGRDDEHVMVRICQEHQIEIPEVEPCDNDSQLLTEFPIRIELLDQEDVLGVVIDADVNVLGRWQSIFNRLSAVGYVDVPRQPNPSGTILEPVAGGLLPKVGVWIMPNNQDPGKLEDFLAFLVPPSDPHWRHAESCVDSLEHPRFRSVDRSKVVIHTWLAWQRNPGRPFGTAIRSRFLNSDAPQAQQLVNWLRVLFG